MGLTIKVDHLLNVTVVSCSGRIVFGEETTELCRSVRTLFPQNRNVVLNLRAVDFVDSGGLGAVVGLVLAARNLGGDLKICDVTRRVREVLRVTHLDSVIDITRHEEEAIGAFREAMVA